jgi:hypothetical protein
MKRLTMGSGAFSVIGLLVLSAHAAPFTGTTDISPAAQNFSPLVQVGCARWGDRCPLGQRIVHGPGGRWWCAPCGGRYGWYGKPYHRYGGYPRRHYYS